MIIFSLTTLSLLLTSSRVNDPTLYVTDTFFRHETLVDKRQ